MEFELFKENRMESSMKRRRAALKLTGRARAARKVDEFELLLNEFKTKVNGTNWEGCVLLRLGPQCAKRSLVFLMGWKSPSSKV